LNDGSTLFFYFLRRLRAGCSAFFEYFQSTNKRHAIEDSFSLDIREITGGVVSPSSTGVTCHEDKIALVGPL
jgi:hypothetical protein